MSEKRDYSTIVFTPEEVGNLGSAYLEQRRDNKELGIPFYNKTLDEILYPLFPGELMSVIARPGCGKTGFMMRMARERASYLRKNNITDRVVVYLTLEQSIEELNAFNVAADKRLSITKMATGEITDDEWVQCLKAGIDRRFVPLWNIGYSSMTDKKQIKIDIDAINGAIDLMSEDNRIDILFVDYLQRIPYSARESKTVGISDNVDALKTIALKKCPVVVGVQARREIDEYALPVPSLDDGQWTSNIEQSSDRVISLVRPAKYRKEGEEFGSVVVRGHTQMLVSVLKQKLGKDNTAKWVFFQPEYNKLDELELQKGQQ